MYAGKWYWGLTAGPLVLPLSYIPILELMLYYIKHSKEVLCQYELVNGTQLGVASCYCVIFPFSA